MIQFEGRQVFDRVLCLAFAPDGKTLAVGNWCMAHHEESPRPTLRLYDVASGKEIQALSGQEGQVAALAFASDGKLLVSAGAGSREPIRMWNLVTGRPIGSLEANENKFCSIALSPSGQILAGAHADGSIRFWETVSGRELARWQRPEGRTIALTFSPDGAILASCGEDTTILLHRVGELVTKFPPRQDRPAPGIAQLWTELAEHDSLKAYRAIATLTAAPNETAAFLKDRLRPAPAYDPNRIQRLIANLDDDNFKVRETASTELEKIGDEALPSLQAAKENGPLEVRRRAERLITVITRRPLAMEWMRDVRAVQALERIGSPEAKSILAQLAKGADQAPLTRHARMALTVLERSRPPDVAVRPVQSRKPVRKDLPPARELQQLWAHEQRTGQGFWDLFPQVPALAFAPDGKLLASAGRDGTVRIWDTKSGEQRHRLAVHKEGAFAVVFSAGGKILVSGGADGVIRCWHAGQGKELHACRGHTKPVVSLVFARDGQTFASGGMDGTIRLWDLATGTEVHRMEGNLTEVTALAFSPDGTILASGGWEETSHVLEGRATRVPQSDVLRLWGPATGKALRALPGRGDFVKFSPDGKLLTAGGVMSLLEKRGGAFHGWNIIPEERTQRWELATGQRILDIPGSPVGQSPDGKMLVVRSSHFVRTHGGWSPVPWADPGNNTLCLVDASTGKTVLQLNEESAPVAVFSRDGKMLATASMNGVVMLWAIER